MEDVIEELIGEISDEYDIDDSQVQRLPGGVLVLHARLPIDEASAVLGVELPEGDWDTLGGLMFHLLGHVPFEGESVVHDGLRLRAEQVKGRRIGAVRVERVGEST
jgi:CBS domain containing-hemolysin-like protein